MAKRKRMDQIKSVLRNYLACGSIKGTARQLKMSKNTVREYLRRAQAHCSELSELLDLEDEQLHQIFYPSEAQQASHRSKVFDEQVDYWLKELGRVGVTRQLLWEEYRSDHSDGYGYSQFCDRLRRAIKCKDLTLALEHNPGEVLMLDFAGK
jgi:transposase